MLHNYTDTRAAHAAMGEHLEELQRAYQWAQMFAWSVVDNDGQDARQLAQEFLDRFEGLLKNTASTLS